MSSLQKHLLKNLPRMNRPPIHGSSSGAAAGRGGASAGRTRDYTPAGWEKYYDAKDDVEISEGNVFRVYRTGTSGPLLVLLHGGGYSGLTWALMAANIITLVDCRVLAIDLRGHGSTVTSDDEDLSATTLSNDVGAVITKLFSDEIPPIILIGHSMGGAIAVHVAHRNLIPLLGLIVIDVVEGTALDALQSMQCFLRGRPTSFVSIEKAIEWCVRSGQVRNIESAKVSMPGQIKNVETDHLGSLDVSESSAHDPLGCQPKLTSVCRGSSILEENEEEDERDDEGDNGSKERRGQSALKANAEPGRFKVPAAPSVIAAEHYTWRIDLSRTEKHWTGWFQGLSDKFLDCTPAKMLLLAGIDRLDKDLTIGQMQGKFQCVVLPQCGHAVHEDVPEKVAEVLASFMLRNKFAQPTNGFEVY